MATINTGNTYAYTDATGDDKNFGTNPGLSQVSDREPLEKSFGNNANVFRSDTGPHVIYMGDQLCLSIAVTLFCFWPVGIVAMMRSSEAKVCMASNDMLRAQIYAREARRLSKISFFINVSLIAFMIILMIIITTASK